MAFRTPKGPIFSALNDLKKAAVRRRVMLLEEARLNALYESEATTVNLLTDTQAAAELGIRANGQDL